MTTTKIPAQVDALKDHLGGLNALLTSKEWERAAIVFAFTGVGGPRNSRQPEPPRMNIRTFAAQGYAGLTTNKTVTRYRAAWVMAINAGWAVPVNPGDLVRLPQHPFPSWKVSTTKQARLWRPVEQRVFTGIDQASIALRRLPFITQDIDPAFRAELADRLTKLREETDEALSALAALTPRRHLTRV